MLASKKYVLIPVLFVCVGGGFLLMLKEKDDFGSGEHGFSKGRVSETTSVTARGDKPRVVTLAHSKDKNNAAEESFDIEAKLEDLASMAYGDEYQSVLAEIAKYYGEFDPNEGKEWLLTLESSPENSPAFMVFGHSYSLVFGVESLDFFNNISHETFRDKYLKGAVPALSLNSGQEVVDFLLAHEKDIGNLKAHFAGVAGSVAMVSLDKGFDIVNSGVVPDEYRGDMYTGFFSSIATVENWSGAAIEYLDKISDEDSSKFMEKILTEMVMRSPKQSFEQVSEVLNSVPSSNARDQAIAGFSNAIVGHAPNSAAFWINEIADQKIRDRVAVQAINQIQNFDKDLSVQLLEQMNLSPKVKDKLVVGANGSTGE